MIICGLIVRVIISMVVVSGNGFNLMERIFIGAAWVPKATVQVCFIRHLDTPLILLFPLSNLISDIYIYMNISIYIVLAH